MTSSTPLCPVGSGILSPVVWKFSNNTSANRYIVVQVLSQTDSTDVVSALRDPAKSIQVLFSDSGNIQFIKNGILLRSIKNNFSGLPDGAIAVSPTALLNSPTYNPSSGQNFFFSYSDGRWILDITDPNSVKILYNPVPRPEFVDYFYSNEGESQSVLYNLCREKIGDPVCPCLNDRGDPTGNNDFCMIDYFGGPQLQQAVKKKYGGSSVSGYDAIAPTCSCFNPTCIAREANPFMKAYRCKNPCPTSMNISICETSFNATGAGSSLSTGNLNLKQQCENQVASSTTGTGGGSTGGIGIGTGTTPTGTTGTTPTGTGTGTTPTGTGTGTAPTDTKTTPRTFEETPNVNQQRFDKLTPEEKAVLIIACIIGGLVVLYVIFKIFKLIFF